MNYNSITDQKKVKQISYEYLLYKLVEWKCENNKFETIEDFNAKNDFTLTHLIVSPFFTCTANGSFDFLFDLFGDFYAMNDGHNSEVALETLLFNDNILTNFIFDKTSFRLKIKSNGADGFLKPIEKSILQMKVDTNIEFKDIFFTNNNNINKDIFKAIDNSIKALKVHTAEKNDLTGQIKSVFIDYSAEDITTISMQHRSWVIMFDEKPKNINQILLSKDLVRKDLFVYTPIEEFA